MDNGDRAVAGAPRRGRSEAAAGPRGGFPSAAGLMPARVLARLGRRSSRFPRIVKTIVLRSQPTGALASAAFRCTLPKGAYRFTVYATDLAGNVQQRAGSNSLTVR